MPDYDRQVIAQFLSGDPSDTLIRDNAQAISDKSTAKGLPSVVCTIPIAGQGKDINDARWWWCGEQIGALTAQSRLYLQGHGDWQTQKLADWGPVETADLLASLGLKAVKLISILGCSLGADRGAAADVRIMNSADSYASRLHLALKARHGIETVVAARIFNVHPVGPLLKQIYGVDDVWTGAKLVNVDTTDATEDLKHKQPQSKLLFYWEGGQQTRYWAY